MKFSIVSLWLALSTLSIALGQTSLRVIIQDAESGKPLMGATAQLTPASLGATADATGRLVLTVPTAGRYALTCSFVGYQPKMDSLTLPALVDSLVVQLVPSEGEELEEVMVTSTRSNRSIDDIPTRIEVIIGEELEEKANMRPGDIRMQLNESTGIQLQQTSPVSANANIRIQGLDGRYTQILQDGLPLYSGFATGLSILQIPPLNLRQVEVIKGSASTLYGGGAIAGLVNLITKRPTAERELSFMLNGTTARGLDLSGFWGQKWEKVGVTMFAAHNTQREYDPGKTGFSALPHYERYTVNPRLYFYLNPSATLTVGAMGNWENRIGGDMQVLNGRTDNTHQYFERNRSDRVASQLQFDKRFERSVLTLKNSISYFNRMITQPDYRFAGHQVASFTEASFTHTGTRSEWIGGGNLWTEQFTEDGSGQGPSGRGRNYRYVTAGAFAQNNYTLRPWMTLETGLRGDYHNRFGFFALPRVSALFKLSDRLTSRLGGGLGYKAPTIFTEDAESVAFRNVRPIDPTTAQAETSIGGNFDINYRTTLFDVIDVSINQLFFYTKLDHALVLDIPAIITTGPSAAVYQFTNANGPIDSRGLETNLRLGYEAFKLYAGYSLVDTRRRYNGAEFNSAIPLTAKHRVNLVAVYELEGKFRLGLEAYYIGPKPLSTGETSRSYWLMGVMGERRWKRFSVFANFENILNVRQDRYQAVILPPIDRPSFREVWAPLEGFVGNGGLKLFL
ncbi:TonB-dependent receptor [Spirosoma utsteinense]|uniref:Iron complex outermembrane receptor protein n=1 Tax=Spirosoma utsteinense TaxID=2585773 RepID=A0ABR6WEK2_9BACT|nr:TonB-dependent receptor [Spirosoma utsteinense]MBC3789255.1 iron complex outermembrane receptor protein [Spirosoma utsteinense]MBC3794957.1 iron complex outermembrane receptor protein [Spirosoma utsteinense]